jgi:hypothetical protein
MSMNTELRPKMPGRLMLRLVRRMFDDAALTKILEPAIADLQRETAAAARGPALLVARVRGYFGLSKVIIVAALMPSAGAGAPLLPVLLGLNGGFLVAVLTPLLFAATWPQFGFFTTGAVVAGLAFAFVVRSWNARHPITLARRRAAFGKDPEINISGIPVGGDFGGFLFVIASVVMMMGLPDLRGFVVGATLVALFVACGLMLWRRSHLQSPVRRIIGS